ncbi:MAG: archease [Candidatus Omnitrophota bacterium]
MKKKSQRKKFEIIEHTADIGLRAFGKNKKELFLNAAQGMFSIIADQKPKPKKGQPEEVKVLVTANNAEELLVSWLSELLSLADIKRGVASQIRITKLSGIELKASIAFTRLEHNYEAVTEIKAVTYHQLKITRVNNSWQAEVIFDV